MNIPGMTTLSLEKFREALRTLLKEKPLTTKEVLAGKSGQTANDLREAKQMLRDVEAELKRREE